MVEVEAGIQWRPLVDDLLARRGQRASGASPRSRPAPTGSRSAVRSRPTCTGADWMKPFVGDVESFVLVDADARRCAAAGRERRAVPPGARRLRAVRPRLLGDAAARAAAKVRAHRRGVGDDELPAFFRERIAEGFLYGDFQFAVDAESDCFLRHGVFSCYGPVERRQAAGRRRRCRSEDWSDLIRLAHVDKARAFRRYATTTSPPPARNTGRTCTSSPTYVDDYHAAERAAGRTHGERDDHGAVRAARAPRRLPGRRRGDCRATAPSVIYGTVRLIERDDETFLPWATESYACVVLNLHVEHTPRGMEQAAAPSAPDRPRHRPRRQLLPHLPPLRHAGAGGGVLPAVRRVPAPQAGARPAGALPERLVPPLRRVFVDALE